MTTFTTTGPVLGQAIRVLMRRWALSQHEAAAALIEAAGELEIGVVDLAGLVVASEDQQRADPQPRTAGPATSGRPGPAAALAAHEPPAGGARWLGATEGLARRESETIVLLAQGLSNQEIARRMCVSINSVKGYIRSAYRKMGVDSRTRALLWAIDHGLGPQLARRNLVAALPAARVPPASAGSRPRRVSLASGLG